MITKVSVATPKSPAQIFAWRREVRAGLIADRLSIDPVDRRKYAGRIADLSDLSADAVGGKDAPALFSTKMNNNFTVVDEVAKEGGEGMAATLFVKGGDDYIRVATNVPKPDGGRAIGTVLDGPALESIKAGKAYSGEVPVLGTPYIGD